MAVWTNQNLVVYHGTDDQAFRASPAINLNLCKPDTDFGQGFYTTTRLHEAKQWANERVRRVSKSGLPRSAAVYRFEIDRDDLARLDSLVFVRATADFWSFVEACRLGGSHSRNITRAANGSTIYDIVSGQVTLWPQRLIIADCDQFSFHTRQAVNLLSGARSGILPSSGRYF